MRKFTFAFFIFVLTSNTFGQFQPTAAETAKTSIDNLASAFSQAELLLLNKGFESGLELSIIPQQEIALSKGFLLENSGGCSLKLQNEAGIIPSVFVAEDNPTMFGNTREFFYGLSHKQVSSHLELLIPLYELNEKKGKKPHRLSDDPRKTERYGKWAVQLKARKDSPVRLIATDATGRIEKLDGQILTFVFNNETAATNFDSGFRNAIKACRSYDPGPKPQLPPGIIVN